jgi:hypothetical protein
LPQKTSRDFIKPSFRQYEEIYDMTRQKPSPQKLAAIMKANANMQLFARNRALGGSDTDTLAAIIRNPEKKMIVGLFGDNGEPDYCGMLVIKGQSFGFEDVSGDDIDAIHCKCAEEAIAMRQVFGDDAAPFH